MTEHCPACRAKLPRSGRCPGLAPLIERDGRSWGIAAQIAHALGGARRDVTESMVINWRVRDGLPSYRFGRTVYHALDEAAPIELAKRLTKEQTGKGHPRRLDVGLVTAA
ncbi:hypothetical protein [Verrucosispora sp. NA02020]|uniref:hypothetical protein n=1 Tax=Verrucosispora sp. NA02020 TaxID=2742132 RepID=UPI003D703DA5